MALTPDQLAQARSKGLISDQSYERAVAKLAPSPTQQVAAEPAVVSNPPELITAPEYQNRPNQFEQGEAAMMSAMATPGGEPVSTVIPNFPQAQSVVKEKVPISELQTPPQPQPVQSKSPGIDNSAFAKYEQSIKDAANAGAVIANQEAAFTNSFFNTQQAELAKQQKIADEKEQYVQERIFEVNKQLDDIAAQKIDPKRLTKDWTFWDKLGTVFLGALSGKGGSEVFERRIQQDITAQEKDLDTSKDLANKKLSYLQELRNTYKDNNSAREALRAGMYQAAQIKLSGLAAQSKNAQVQANAQQQLAELELKKQEALTKIAESAGKQANMQQLQAADPITAKILGFPDNIQKPLLEAKEVYDATNAALQSIDSSYAATKDIGVSGKIPFTEAKSVVDAENAKIESAIRATMKGQGTIQESEIDRLVKPFLISTSDREGQREIKKMKLKQLLVTKNAGQLSKLKNFGITNTLPGESSAKSLKEK